MTKYAAPGFSHGEVQLYIPMYQDGLTVLHVSVDVEKIYDPGKNYPWPRL